MAKKRDWIIGGLILFCCFIVVLIFAAGFWGISADSGSLGISGNKIGLIELEGVILSSRTVVQKLERLLDSDAISAVVVRINSPGGGVAALTLTKYSRSQETHSKTAGSSKMRLPVERARAVFSG